MRSPSPVRHARPAPARAGAVIGMMLLAVPSPGGAVTEVRSGALCDAAAAQASAATGVPLPLLRAIGRAESGRNLGDGALFPWPWTVNAAGRGHWFATQAEALAFAEARIAEGAGNVDIGCFQINHRWHGAAFESVAAMLDPAANALYAARFLARLRAETGSWEAAVGAYHSRSPERAERYRARVDAALAALTPPGAAPAPPGDEGPAPRPARQAVFYPLLRAGPPASAGSLMPARAGRGASLLPVAAGPLLLQPS